MRIRLTGTNPAGATTLAKTADFTVEAKFDLIAPDDLNEAYGIRLTDRLAGVNVGGTTGNDVVELRVAKNASGGLQVQFRDIDFQQNVVSGTPLGLVTTLQNIGFTAAIIQAGEQIVLRLSHAAGSNVITASYDLYDAAGNQLDANGTQAGLTQTFTPAQTGMLFSDENWTQVQIHASAPATNNSYLTGTYGTLNVDPTGLWSYTLLNSSNQVQSLAAGAVVQDIFTVRVADEFGATDTETITIDVTGVNDAPVITSGAQSGAATEIVDLAPDENTATHNASGAGDICRCRHRPHP